MRRVFLAAYQAPHASGPEYWGDVATWVSAISTAAALFAAGFVVWIELNRDRKRNAQERAAQASHIAAWVEWGEQESRWVMRLQNGSPLPIYSLRVDVLRTPPNSEANQSLFTWKDGMPIPPGRYAMPFPATTQYSAELAGDPTDPENFLPRTYSLRIRFRDSSGLLWYRHGDGTLTEFNWPDPYPPASS